jgi:hypothetical protein
MSFVSKRNMQKYIATLAWASVHTNHANLDNSHTHGYCYLYNRDGGCCGHDDDDGNAAWLLVVVVNYSNRHRVSSCSLVVADDLWSPALMKRALRVDC